MNISSLSNAAFQRPDPSEIFKKADADGSGGISKDELSTMMSNRPGRPGGAQESEASGPDVEEIFTEIDVDGNGEISEEENTAHMENMESQGMPPPPPGGSFSGSSDSLQSLLSSLSSDSSGKSQGELISKLVSRMKENGDGTSLFGASA